MIRASGLGHTFASRRVGIAAVDLDVEAGELVALLGPNGSGKTTLLRILAGDLAATAGKLHAAATRLAFAGAQPIHFDELTARDNARFFAHALGADDAAVEHQLAAFSLLADADITVAEYSFGMQRKLLLAEAFAAKPDLLLLDEPTIGLDPDAVRVVRDALHDHVRAGNLVVMATNDVHFALHATRVVFLQNGRKIADAPPAQLLQQLRGATRIEVALSGQPEREPAFAPGVSATRVEDAYLVDAKDAGALPQVCGALIAAGAVISSVNVHEPNLADVYRQLTGQELKRDADV